MLIGKWGFIQSITSSLYFHKAIYLYSVSEMKNIHKMVDLYSDCLTLIHLMKIKCEHNFWNFCSFLHKCYHLQSQRNEKQLTTTWVFLNLLKELRYSLNMNSSVWTLLFADVFEIIENHLFIFFLFFFFFYFLFKFLFTFNFVKVSCFCSITFEIDAKYDILGNAFCR